MPAPLMPPPTTSTSQSGGDQHSVATRAFASAANGFVLAESWRDNRIALASLCILGSFQAAIVLAFAAKLDSLRFAHSSHAPRSASHAMTPNPRQAELLDAVRARGSITVEALAERFGVTLQTVRRDVQLLADAGLLARFHGGVRVPSSTTENIALPAAPAR